MSGVVHLAVDLPEFDRKFWDGTFRFTRIGNGALGGKASGLTVIQDLLSHQVSFTNFPNVAINVPTMAVIATDFFDEFLAQNNLANLPFSDLSDERIAYAFQTASLPVELLGDLRALIGQVKTPLAIRSSSLLEDALEHPFAGVYATKMIPNNKSDTDTRFRRLTEAIKFVYASTYFREARDYIRSAGRKPSEEKMAVIIQEIVGQRHGDRFYPEISGVARSYNFYPVDRERPEDGVVNLALGLGKTIVDAGIAWTFSPKDPRSSLFGSVQDLLRGTQTEFWAVNMGPPPAYDPVNEMEYLVRATLADADADDVLRFVASTFDPERDRVIPGVGNPGPRILNFAPLLVLELLPLTAVLRSLLNAAEEATGAKVEIELAITLQQQPSGEPKARVGFLQMRPMVVSDQIVEITNEDLSNPLAIVASEMVMGNGVTNDIRDIVFVRPERFSPMQTSTIAQELDQINRALVDEGRPCLLIGFGRWGSSQPSLGIPVGWSQISSARAIVEATLPAMNVELSQGSHFFHNMTSFRASYFMVRHDRSLGIDWQWLDRQTAVRETEFLKHVRLRDPLSVRIDGRRARGVILRPKGESNENKR